MKNNRNKSGCVKDLNIKGKIINNLEDNTEDGIHDLGQGRIS